MLEKITVAEVKHVAGMAKAAREARDKMLDKIRDEDLGEPKPARGEHNPSAGLGLDPLPPDHPVRAALREAITALASPARRELRALMGVGQGDYAAGDWQKALADAAAVRDEATIAALIDQSDLHEYLMKGLYELGIG
jgi:hypothetical protein